MKQKVHAKDSPPYLDKRVLNWSSLVHGCIALLGINFRRMKLEIWKLEDLSMAAGKFREEEHAQHKEEGESEGKREKWKLASIHFLWSKSKVTNGNFSLALEDDSQGWGGPTLAATWLVVVGPTQADLLPHFVCNSSDLWFSTLPGLRGSVFQT